MDFELDEELLNLQQDTIVITGEIPIEGENHKSLERILNVIVDSIQDASSNITDANYFDQIRSFIKHFNTLKKTTAIKAWDIILSGFAAEIAATGADLDLNDPETYMLHRKPLEMYGFLIYWVISVTEQRATSKASAAQPTKGRGKARAGSKAAESGDTDDSVNTWTGEKQKALDLMCRCLELDLHKIWLATHEKESFISLFFKPAYQLLENKDNIRLAGLRRSIYRTLSLCINLQYWEHTPEPMAELLQMLIVEFEYPQLADDILRDVSAREFDDQTIKDASAPKAFARFLVRLSELAPKAVLKQMGLLIEHLDGDSANMRQAIVEVIGSLIEHLSQQEQTDQVKNQIDGFFDILEERFMDVNSYVRSKVVQTVLKLCDLKTKFPKRRQRLTELVIGRLSDKSFLTRKVSIKCMVRLIESHPYSMHGGELDLEEWETRFKQVTEELRAMVEQPSRRKSLKSPEDASSPSATAADGSETAMEVDENKEKDGQEDEQDDSDDHGGGGHRIELPTDEEAAEIMASKEYVTKTLQKRYYADAARFIHQIHRSVPIMCELLASTTKLEVVEAMEFFVTLHRYKVRTAEEGIRKMVHLVWVKDGGDEAKSVRNRLMECYWQIYLAPDENLSDKENTAVIARNLVSLTYGSTLAELTSLEQLLSTIVAESATSDIGIPEDVIEKLWQVYSHHREIPHQQRRGAIIILGMLAKAKPEIVSQKIDVLLRIGLGKHGRTDLALARYTCIALQRITGEKKKQKGTLGQDTVRLAMDHPVFARLNDLIDMDTKSKLWFGVAEQALNTIYILGEQPDILCGDIIKARVRDIFGLQQQADEASFGSSQRATSSPVAMSQPEELTMTMAINPENAFTVDSWRLAQLLFIVGHVAIKHIVHMEIIEEEFKRRKMTAQADKKKENNPVDDELDQVVGTTEDEFGDALAHIRERELLFGEDSLLSVFGPMIVTICGNNTLYDDKTLQSAATLALCKLMCVSADFCEHNLQLLFTILEKSKEPTIRSNIIIALGDMAVCFNNLIDANIAYLYKRLADPDNAVKKNTLMVLTHLILNGMVKVKGQLGEMAICLVDEDTRIADLARLFFTELTSKDNAVYNNMPDIISHLSNSEAKVDEEAYKKIMRFLFELIKDRTMENMIEKLCQRFKNTEEPRGWRDIAFCLSMLPFKNERSFKRLLEGFSHFQDKLHEEQVHKYMLDIINKGRLIKPPKPEMKPVVDEFEAKLTEYKTRGDEMHETATKAILAVKKGGKRGAGGSNAANSGDKRGSGNALAGLKVRVPASVASSSTSEQGEAASIAATRPRRGKASNKRLTEVDDDDEEEVEEGEEEETEAAATVSKTRSSSTAASRSSSRRGKDADGDVEMEEDEDVDEGEKRGTEPTKRGTRGESVVGGGGRAKKSTAAAAAAGSTGAKRGAGKATEKGKGKAKGKGSSKGKKKQAWSEDDEESEAEEDFSGGSDGDAMSDVELTSKSSSRKASSPAMAAPPPPPQRTRRLAAAKAKRIIESEDDEDEDEDY
ncbi:Condensin complex subunit [Actinomortierella ambigua]|uniref:Condensin complex subunit n=1 Tax=Actinomortierella ambigua TaxID=1343610 RepID=A0A9P6Q4P0_9FUNG|nr:Condensin complex subunit [Actinomortierella ambigua]